MDTVSQRGARGAEEALISETSQLEQVNLRLISESPAGEIMIKFAGSYKEQAMIELSPIGIIHTPFSEREGMPIQPAGARGVRGQVEIYEAYQAGLADLDGFSHIILLYYFHRSEGYDLQVVPFLDSKPRGLFATRAPKRPNPLGLSIVQLEGIEQGQLHIRDVDILDGTPLLDIKPYVPAFDNPAAVRLGWLEDVDQSVIMRRADERFS